MKEVVLSKARSQAIMKLGAGIGELREPSMSRACDRPINLLSTGEEHKPTTTVKLWKPWFDDVQLEEEYREAAYTLQRRSIVKIAGAMALMDMVLLTVELVDLDFERVERWYYLTYLVLRILSPLVAAAIALRIWRGEAGELPHHQALRWVLIEAVVLVLMPSLNRQIASQEPDPAFYVAQVRSHLASLRPLPHLVPPASITGTRYME